jgi:hypothetical protein
LWKDGQSNRSAAFRTVRRRPAQNPKEWNMSRTGRLAALKVAAALMTVAAAGVLASPAFAVTTGESVSGTALPALSLTVGTGALFTTNFAPGATATSTGALTATDTSPSWHLQVKDNGTGAGKMIATGGTCTGSDPTLTNALGVTLNNAGLGGVTTDPQVSISGSNQEVAAATNQLLAANVFTTSYSQAIPSSQVMLTGCVYSLTATYTLQ